MSALVDADVATGDRVAPVAPHGYLPGAARLRRAGVELLVGGLVAAAVSLAIQLVADRLRMPPPSYVPDAVRTVALTALLGVVALLVLRRPWARWATALSWASVSALVTLPVALVLHDTRYYLGGISIDESFRLEYFTRMASTAKLADLTYFGVPPYYPAGWFWLGGRFADVTGMPAWAAYKYFAVATMAVAPVAAFVLWSLVVRRRTALLLAILTGLVGLRFASIEPYSWLVSAVIPPLAVLAWRLVRRLAEPAPGRTAGPVVVLGVALGAFGACYTLLFGFFAALLVVLGVAGIVLAVRAGSGVATRLLVRRVLGRGALIGAVALPLVLLVWAPYLLGSLTGGRSTPNVASHYLPENGAQPPWPMFEFSLTGALALAGVGWLLLNVRRPVAQALGLLVATCYLWYLLSDLALGVGATLLAFRVEPLLTATLVCAGLLGLLDAARLGAHAVSRRRPDRRAGVRALALGLAFAGVFSLVQTTPTALAYEIDRAYHDYYPTGGTALGPGSPHDADYWVPQLNAAIAQLGGRAPSDTVVLTDSALLLASEPYWGFQALTKHYANPAADFDGRRAAVDAWSRAGSPAKLLAELAASPYRPPSVFVFNRAADGLHMDLTTDVFPAEPNVHHYDDVFPAALFADPRFAVRDVGPFTVVVIR